MLRATSDARPALAASRKLEGAQHLAVGIGGDHARRNLAGRQESDERLCVVIGDLERHERGREAGARVRHDPHGGSAAGDDALDGSGRLGSRARAPGAAATAPTLPKTLSSGISGPEPQPALAMFATSSWVQIPSALA